MGCLVLKRLLKFNFSDGSTISDVFFNYTKLI